MKANTLQGFLEPPLETGLARSGRLHGGDYRHLQLHEGEQGIAWLLLDQAGAEANRFDEAFFDELGQALDELAGVRPHALVIRSVKASGFATGADLRMLQRMTQGQAIEAQLRAAHALIDRLDALPFRGHRRDPRALPGRRPRTCAGLRLAHRALGRKLRLP